MKHHILMADIIKSSKHKSNLLMQEFRETSNKINHKFKKNFHSPITITLGDEFQCIVTSLRSGIEVIVAFEENILMQKEKFKLRYVFNYGDIDTPVNPNKAYEMLGKGLSDARELLDKLKKGNKRFFVNEDDKNLSKKINLSFFIYQSLIDDWKEKDYKIVTAFLKHRDYKLVAKEMEKDVSLMWKREKSLNIEEYLAVKELLLLLSN